eukprot:1515812-Pleurochrysis_carterae.AAC.2
MDIIVRKKKSSTRKKDSGKEREIKSSNGVDTCITLGDTQGANKKKVDSGGGKRSGKITY